MVFFIKKLLPVLFLGGAAGFLNGLLGAGGGIPLVFGLRALWGKKVEDGRRFFTTALAVMLPLSLYSVSKYPSVLPPACDELLFVALPAALGGLIGALSLSRLSMTALNRIFSGIIILSGFLMVI
jgi:uncharacterized membrane protein YfcA